MKKLLKILWRLIKKGMENVAEADVKIWNGAKRPNASKRGISRGGGK